MKSVSHILLSRGERHCAAVAALLLPVLLLWSVCFDVVIVHSHAGQPAHLHAGRAIGFAELLLPDHVDDCHVQGEISPSSHDETCDGDIISSADCRVSVIAANSDGFVRHERGSALLLLDLLCIALPCAWQQAQATPIAARQATPLVLDASPPMLDVVRCAVLLI